MLISSIREKERPTDLGHSHGPGRELGETDYSSPQAHFDVIILEAGIIFHSYVVISLSATVVRLIVLTEDSLAES